MCFAFVKSSFSCLLDRDLLNMMWRCCCHLNCPLIYLLLLLLLLVLLLLVVCHCVHHQHLRLSSECSHTRFSLGSLVTPDSHSSCWSSWYNWRWRFKFELVDTLALISFSGAPESAHRMHLKEWEWLAVRWARVPPRARALLFFLTTPTYSKKSLSPGQGWLSAVVAWLRLRSSGCCSPLSLSEHGAGVDEQDGAESGAEVVQVKSTSSGCTELPSLDSSAHVASLDIVVDDYWSLGGAGGVGGEGRERPPPRGACAARSTSSSVRGWSGKEERQRRRKYVHFPPFHILFFYKIYLLFYNI